MTNSISSSTSSWFSFHHSAIDSLNQVMDPVSVLSDVELQKELSIFADAQFTHDTAPGTAIDSNKTDTHQQEKQPSESSAAQKTDMHSLLNIKLASLAKSDSCHTSMTADAIASYYDESPDCSPPNGYHSPNPSPPNGFYSPNPTPPNGFLANVPSIFNAIVNPSITFYGEDSIMGYNDDEFIKTMRILSNNPNDNNNQQQMRQQLDQMTNSSVPLSGNNAVEQQQAKITIDSTPMKRSNISSTCRKRSAAKKKEQKIALPVESEDEDENDDVSVNDYEEESEMKASSDNNNQQQPVLSKEDKRRRNTAASARFRIKKKQREKSLQKTAEEMTEKANAFEARVHELEREIKWLKALIVEKKEGHLDQILMQQFVNGSSGSTAMSSSSQYSFNSNSYSKANENNFHRQ